MSASLPEGVFHLLTADDDVAGKEVGYVVRSGRSLVAFEVKTGARRATLSGLAEFAKAFHPDRTLLVGADGIPLAVFLSEPAESWL